MQGVCVQSLVGELGSHMPAGKKKSVILHLYSLYVAEGRSEMPYVGAHSYSND